MLLAASLLGSVWLTDTKSHQYCLPTYLLRQCRCLVRKVGICFHHVFCCSELRLSTRLASLLKLLGTSSGWVGAQDGTRWRKWGCGGGKPLACRKHPPYQSLAQAKFAWGEVAEIEGERRSWKFVNCLCPCLEVCMCGIACFCATCCSEACVGFRNFISN